MTTAKPAGYYALQPGTKYVVLGGAAVPLSALTGKTQGSQFYPDKTDGGYLIRTRQETAREQCGASKSAVTKPALAASRAPFQASDLDLWK